MAFPVLKYSASSGSDTLASGAGPDTAVTGTNGDLSGSTLTLNGTFDFTGATDDGGSDVVWYESASGDRHLFRIQVFVGGVATCTALTLTQTGTTRTGLDWSVGGYRATLDNDTSRQDITDYAAGWTAELESGTYIASSAYTAPAGSLTNGPVTFRAASGATPTISWIGNHQLFNVSVGDVLHLEGLTLSNVVSTNVGAQCLDIGSNGYVKAVNCTMRSARAVDCSGGRLTMVGCDVQSDVDYGVILQGAAYTTLTDCDIHDCGAQGLAYFVTVGGSAVVDGCRVYGSTADGVYLNAGGSSAYAVTLKDSVFSGNGGHGVRMAAVAIDKGPNVIINNIFEGNSSYGIHAPSGADLVTFSDFNAYYNNTSGEVTGLTKGEHSITLTADPFTDAAGGDFTLNDTAGGGADCKDVALGYGGSYTWAGVSDGDALVKIKYDPVGGSDTLASGAGPATAITGSAAAHTHGAAGSNKIFLTNSPDLSGVVAGDVLYLATSSGQRHLSAIVSVNDSLDEVFVEDHVFTISSGSPVDYAIGGKRKTLEADTTNTDVAQAKAGWVLELEDGADYNVTVTLAVSGGSLADGPVTVQAASGSSPNLRWTADAVLFSAGASDHLRLIGLDARNTTSTSVNARVVSSATASVQALGCTFDSHRAVYSSVGRAVLVDCDVTAGEVGLSVSGASHTAAISTTIHDCASHGIDGGSAGSLVVASSVVRDNGSRGIYKVVNGAAASLLYVANAVIHGNTGKGVDLDGAMNTANGPVTLLNNSYTSNGAYGISATTAGASLLVHEDHGGYWSNTSGRSNNLDLGANSVIVSVDPYTDESTNDFTLNASATGGALLDSAGFNGWDIGAAQLDGWDIGAYQGESGITGVGAATLPFLEAAGSGFLQITGVGAATLPFLEALGAGSSTATAGVLTGQAYDDSELGNGWHRIFLAYRAPVEERGHGTNRFLESFSAYAGETTATNRGKGTIFAWPQFEYGVTAPTAYQHNPGAHWYPRGHCTRGATGSHTFTITNDD